MLFRLGVNLSPPATSEPEFWARIQRIGRWEESPGERPERKQQIRDKLPIELKERLISLARTAASDRSILKKIRPLNFSQIDVRVLSVTFGSVEALISVAGAKVIAAALATTLPGAAEVIKGVAEETLRDVLQDILGVLPEASVTAEPIDEAGDAGTEAGRATPAASAGAVSLVGLVVLALFAIVYYAINETGERNKTIQAFFAGALEHAKAIDKLELDLINARSVLLKTEASERTELHKLLISLASEQAKAADQHETDLVKARADMLSVWASVACCASQPCPSKTNDEYKRVVKHQRTCPPVAAVQPIDSRTAPQQ